MRIVPIECVKEGSYLAKTLFDDDGRPLLKEGLKLSKNLLRRLKILKIQYLYIVDEYSTEEIEDIIKPELRQKAIKLVKESFSSMNIEGSYNCCQDFSSILGLAEELLEEISCKNNILVNLVDIKSLDNYTYQHSVNVAVLSLVLGIKMGFNKMDLIDLCVGALLHDMGKTFVPKEILNKPAALDRDELAIIQSHPLKGFNYLKYVPSISLASRLIVLRHHEKVDGNGYPYGKSSDEIDVFSKIVSIADVYDALTSSRPYRKALCPNDGVEYILSHVGTDFDCEIVEVFLNTIVPYPVGTLVKLSTGDIAVVKRNDNEFPLRPFVKIIKSSNPKNVGKEVDLVESLAIVINDTVFSV